MGCGTGALAVRMKTAEPGAEIVCIDGDPQVLSIAKRKSGRHGAKVIFNCCFSTRLPF